MDFHFPMIKGHKTRKEKKKENLYFRILTPPLSRLVPANRRAKHLGTGGRNDKSKSFPADLRSSRLLASLARVFNPDISRIITFVCPILGILVAAVTSCYARETSFTLQVLNVEANVESLSTKTGRNGGTISRCEGAKKGGWVGPTNEHVHHYVCIVDNWELLNPPFSLPWTSVYRVLGNKICGTEAIINVVGCVARPLFNPFGVQKFISPRCGMSV